MAAPPIGGLPFYMVIDELVRFAKKNHAGFENMPDDVLRRMFEVYQKTTIVDRMGGEICGVGLYQEWPDLLNFICLIGDPKNSVFDNVLALMKATEFVPDKKIVFFDETKMRLKVCRQLQQDGQH